MSAYDVDWLETSWSFFLAQFLEGHLLLEMELSRP